MQQQMLTPMSTMANNQAAQNHQASTLTTSFKEPKAKDPDTFEWMREMEEECKQWKDLEARRRCHVGEKVPRLRIH